MFGIGAVYRENYTDIIGMSEENFSMHFSRLDFEKRTTNTGNHCGHMYEFVHQSCLFLVTRLLWSYSSLLRRGFRVFP